MDGALILAGGGSTRMGRDKAWLAFGERTLLEHVVALVAACCRPIVVSARPGQSLPPLDPALVERVDDPQDHGGPLVGVVAGLERLAARGVARAYLGSCDAAALSTAHLRFMLDSLAASPASIASVPVDADGRLHPLASAVVVTAMLERATRQLADGQLRLQALFDDPAIVRVDIAQLPDAHALTPCNTPAQWQALRERVRGSV